MTTTAANTNAPPPSFNFRQTGPDTFMVDAGDVYIGTVQKFTSHVWWAYPASTGDALTPITCTTRDDAAIALLAHVASAEADQIRAMLAETAAPDA